ncbi:MAG: ABC transporter ATP-binding protein [Bacteroidota bacterium]
MLEVNEISKSFHQQKVLHDISFSAREGEILGLLGPNGAGKTTLMRIINQIVAPTRGHIAFEEQLLSEKHISKIGYLPEERGLYKTMGVEEHLVFLGRLRGLNKKNAVQKTHHWLEKLDILSWKHKRIEELSKGMAQKVQFIAAVLHDPDLLILDEPFSGFDPVNLRVMRLEIEQFKKEGKAIIISTHNMNSVEELCDRVLLINKGEKVLEGSVLELQQSQSEQLYAVTFQGNMLAFANALWVGFEIIEKKEVSEGVFQVILQMRNDNDINSLLQTIMNVVKIVEVTTVKPSMEAIFTAHVEPQKEERSE